MRMPDYLVADLQPWFGKDLDVASVRLENRGLLSFVFGLLRQWAVTWNGTVHLTRRAPYSVEAQGIIPKREGVAANEARANALWLIAHECLHVQQQREMGWWRFLVAYGWEWLRHRGGSRNKFEGPAYALGDRVYQAQMQGPQQAYCFKCRESPEVEEPRQVTLTTGRLAVVGMCGACGKKVSRIISPTQDGPTFAAPARR